MNHCSCPKKTGLIMHLTSRHPKYPCPHLTPVKYWLYISGQRVFTHLSINLLMSPHLCPENTWRWSGQVPGNHGIAVLKLAIVIRNEMCQQPGARQLTPSLENCRQVPNCFGKPTHFFPQRALARAQLEPRIIWASMGLEIWSTDDHRICFLIG